MQEGKIIYLVIHIFSLILLTEIEFAIAVTTDVNEIASPCDARCGCNRDYVYDIDQKKCVVNMENATEKVIIYNDQDHDILAESRLARLLYLKGEKIFKGIMISVMFFISCASVCVLAACVYCCRINYIDRQLNKDVKALAQKLKRDYKCKKSAAKPTPLHPIAESCNVVVEPAGVFVV